MRSLVRARCLSSPASAGVKPASPPSVPAAAAAASPDPYLHRSILPSYYFQPSLLQLPIPTLSDTLSRYLRSLAPLVTPEAHAQAASLAAQFGAGDGLRLQARLLDNSRAAPQTSYISDDWYDMYLTNRSVLHAAASFIYLLILRGLLLCAFRALSTAMQGPLPLTRSQARTITHSR